MSDTLRQFCQSRSDRECHGKGMNAARQRLRRLDRTTGVRTRSEVPDCIVRTVSFGPDPLETGSPSCRLRAKSNIGCNAYEIDDT